MTMREWGRTPAVRAALVLLAISAGVFVWTLVRAFRGVDVPAAAPITVASIDAIKRGASRPPVDIQAAVDNDLFSPDRSAPASPYRMPGEHGSDDKVRVESMKPAVLGTAVASDGRSFATLQLGDDSPKLVHVGDRIGDWTVRSIARGKVVLTSTSGDRAELAAPKPGF